VGRVAEYAGESAAESMKLCCSSGSYARVLQSGALTQLEWIDRCVELGFDGVDFAATHFPRTDDDYLAQMKKLCVDRGLTAACIAVDVAFGEGDVDAHVAEVEAWIDRAVALGVPLIRFGCGRAAGPAGVAWGELVRGLKNASAAAKDRNTTLAIEPRAKSLVATPSDVKRALKECDSAWLRVALPLDGPVAEVETDEKTLAEAAVIAIARGEDASRAISACQRAGFIGFYSLESTGVDEDAALEAALARLRPALVR
jgi:hypothetical protein